MAFENIIEEWLKSQRSGSSSSSGGSTPSSGTPKLNPKDFTPDKAWTPDWQFQPSQYDQNPGLALNNPWLQSFPSVDQQGGFQPNPGQPQGMPSMAERQAFPAQQLAPPGKTPQQQASTWGQFISTMTPTSSLAGIPDQWQQKINEYWTKYGKGAPSPTSWGQFLTGIGYKAPTTTSRSSRSGSSSSLNPTGYKISLPIPR